MPPTEGMLVCVCGGVPIYLDASNRTEGMIVCVCGGVPIYLDASNRRDVETLGPISSDHERQLCTVLLITSSKSA